MDPAVSVPRTDVARDMLSPTDTIGIMEGRTPSIKTHIFMDARSTITKGVVPAEAPGMLRPIVSDIS